ncbi:CapA family protein, partial [bacterium]|nr:CapA family protein [bacterium]
DGLQETIYILDTAGVAYTGAGMNDLLARRTRFLSCDGVSIAMLCFSDRTGSYNNYQPFLDAGRSRAGFAMWNRSTIEATVPEAVSLADFTVLSVHSGSEYKTQPQIMMQTGLPAWDPEVIIFDVVPDTTERLLRQYAIENGADLVVTHHPHVIQGFEVYQGKLIAHSMGNFVFDLSYAECFPSLILHTHFSAENGIDEAIVHPVYIDNWIPQHAAGGLGRAILDYESEMSRRLDTWLVRQPGEDSARIIWDTTLVSRSGSEWTDTLTLADDDGWWISDAHKMQGDGYPVSVEIFSPVGAEVRVGRDMLWFGNMEDEGADEWYLSNDHETYNEDYYVSGARSVRIQNESSSPWDYESNLRHRKSIDDDLEWSFVGWMMTQNAGNSMIEIEYWTQRGGGTQLGRPTIGDVLTGDNSWTYMSADLDVPSGTNFYDVYMHHFQPSSGTGYAYFDDLALIQWEDWQSSSTAIPFPSDFTYLQVRVSSPGAQAIVHYRREWVEQTLSSRLR